MSNDGSASTNALTTEQSPWWAKLLDRYGIPTILLGVALWGFWQTVSWTATNVGIPLVERHVKFVDAVQMQVEAQTEILRELTEVTKTTQTVLLQNQVMIRDMLKETMPIREVK